jgi:hypothetical protein
VPVFPATRETEARALLEPRSCRQAWATQQDPILLKTNKSSCGEQETEPTARQSHEHKLTPFLQSMIFFSRKSFKEKRVSKKKSYSP